MLVYHNACVCGADMKRFVIATVLLLGIPPQASAWEIGPFKGDDIRIEPPNINVPDVIGDITHPERMWENVKRETENVGREIDRMRLEFNAVSGAPALALWLQQSRNNAINGAVPIPADIRQRLGGFYDEDIYNRVRFKIGDGGAVNLANLSINYGEARAIVLIDVVVFKDEDAARDAVLWAHELKHIQQYRDWGVHDFAIRYLRSWNGVENEANFAEENFRRGGANAHNSPGSNLPPLQVPVQMSTICGTPWGICQTNMPFPRGSQCWCPALNGQPLWGSMQ